MDPPSNASITRSTYIGASRARAASPSGWSRSRLASTRWLAYPAPATAPATPAAIPASLTTLMRLRPPALDLRSDAPDSLRASESAPGPLPIGSRRVDPRDARADAAHDCVGDGVHRARPVGGRDLLRVLAADQHH